MNRNIIMLAAAVSLLLCGCSKDSVEGFDDPSAAEMSRVDSESSIEGTFAVSYKDLIACSDSGVTGMPRPADTYKYPVVPVLGNEKWNTLYSEGGWDAVDKANQIPESILTSMSTEGVFQSIIDFPGFVDRVYLTESTYLQAFLETKDKCNAYSELLKRDDAAEVVCDRYEKFVSRVKIGEGGIVEYNNPVGYFMEPLVGQIISQKEVYSKFDDSELKRIVDRIVVRFVFEAGASSSGLHTIANMELFLARVMCYKGYEPFINVVEQNDDLKTFIETQEGIFYYFDISTKAHQLISEYAKQYWNLDMSTITFKTL